jgi:hypothetical protein
VVARSDGDANVVARVDTDPQARFFKNPSYVRLVARVCGKCGYAELYADEPSGLFSAWTKSQKG